MCTFYVLQEVWRWLWETNHKISLEKHKHLMKTFQNILYPESLIIKRELKIMNFLNGQNMYTIIRVTMKNGIYVLETVHLKAISQIIIVK